VFGRPWSNTRMTELKFFRLTLVLLAGIVLGAGSAWGWLMHRQSQAQASMDNAFGDYNRFLAACGDDKQGGLWDLAQRARETLVRATANRDAYADQAEALLWFALIGATVLVLAFYALRWAMTGRVRPLWLLGRD
jgi:hypothetical protein